MKLLMAVLLAAACSVSAEELKILTVGNSFADSVFVMLPKIVAAQGDKLVLDRANIGGCPLEKHARLIDDCEKDPTLKPYAKKYTLKDLLTKDKWDIVTIQQASPFSWKSESYHPHIDRLVDFIRKNAPQAEIVIQQTWAYRSDAKQFTGWKIDQAEMHKRLTENYTREAQNMHFRMIPSGNAVALARATQKTKFVATPAEEIAKLTYPNLPNQNGSFIRGYSWNKNAKTGQHQMGADFIHLNTRGQYLQSCVWYAYLFNKNVADCKYVPSGIDAEDAAFLRVTAQKAVDEQKKADQQRLAKK